MNHPTVRDIAKKANVSASTVSRVLNNYPHISDNTRRLVWKAVRELNYQIQPAPDAQTYRVALFTRALERFYANDHIQTNVDRDLALGASDVFIRHGVQTTILSTPRDEREIAAFDHEHKYYGALLLGGVQNRAYIQHLIDMRFPFVLVASHMLPLPINYVMPDIIYGMEQAVDLLTRKGCRQFGLVNGPGTTKTSAEKARGVHLALTLRSLPFSAERIIESDFTTMSGYTATLELLQRVPELDAVLYAYDALAMGGIKAIKESGRRVPDDVAVIAFHNSEFVEFVDPPLTTISYDTHLTGATAAQRLLTLLKSPRDESHHAILMPTELIVRHSA